VVAHWMTVLPLPETGRHEVRVISEGDSRKKIFLYPPTVLLKQSYVILAPGVTRCLFRCGINHVSVWNC
jgi:hypothetical protein